MSDFEQMRRKQEALDDENWVQWWTFGMIITGGLLIPVYPFALAHRYWKKGEPERERKRKQQEQEQRDKEAHEARMRLLEEERKRVAKLPPPPQPAPPPTEEQRLAAAFSRYQARLRALEAGGLDATELGSAKDQAKMLYLQELSEVLK